VQFTKLRLTGFKSFVDPAELWIEPGMTGVVGPNGCGKSNLVEALRWVMGETSAKQMRGGEMDDVIFGGSQTRPPKSHAEVVLVLDNRSRTAPAPFNDDDELEISRRIDRGEGSTYRVNGKEVRARDVHLLFADVSTGARSPALVSQGKVGSLINAKPSDRRALLEDAAGIGGLHSRRHEAELRLRAADANLARLEDVMVTLDAQLQSLRKQARQAARYRAVGEQIREVEARLLHLRWIAALGGLDAARDQRQESEAKVAELTELAAAAAARQADATAGLPALRQAEAEAAARLQRLIVAREQLDGEEKRLAESRREAERRLAQADADLEREEARYGDAEAALARLAEERAALVDAAEGESEAEAEARAAFEAASAAADQRDAEVQRLTQAAAAAEAERGAALRRIGEAEGRRRRIEGRLQQAAAQRAAAEADLVDDETMIEAEMRLESAAEAVESAAETLSAAESAHRQAVRGRDAARESLQAETAARARLRAEEDGLVAVLASHDEAGAAPVLDALGVRPGWEAALGAALGDDLSAPADAPDRARRWETLPPLDDAPALPGGVAPLSEHVTSPPALARRLAQVGVVADPALGGDLRRELRPGQRLVSTAGDLWRWDGFTVAAGAPDAATVRLRQKNRLLALREQIAEADLRVETAEAALEDASTAMDAAAAAEARARDALRAAEAAAAAARDEQARLSQRAAAAASRLAALVEAEDRLRGDLAEAAAEEDAARVALEDAGDGTALRQKLAELRAELAERRAAVVDARSVHDRLLREAGDRRRRLEALASEAASWQQRLDAAAVTQEELADRRETALGELERLAELPLEIEARRQELLDRIQAADEQRAAAAVALAEAERLGDESGRALKLADQALAAAREDRVRHEAALESATQACRAVAQRIAERLDCTPEQLGRRMAEAPAEPADPDDLDRRLERLVRERDAMGPVNLRAETEAAELDGQMNGMRAEREDLVAAIAKLRHAIAEINREGRDRLLASFRHVDAHFRELFVRLFGGGRAHLELVESADPLEAGLEIMASPPGKRLQVLSLLSGGEQALTALALIFAVFMTNPAPICVLDEVDAPLDDANVDRFCTLVSEIARGAATRFLVVTHHRMTMARVDRLFGVTMSERGISQLVSVDLRAAEALREPA